MSKIRRNTTTGSNVAETRNVLEIKNKTGNLYESIAIIAKRANLFLQYYILKNSQPLKFVS